MQTSSIPKLATRSVQGALAQSYKVFNLDDTDYHGDIHVQSCSMLKPILTSPAHYQRSLIDRIESTPSMEFGSLVHLLTLEPHLVLSKVAVFPGVAPKLAESRAFQALNPGKMIFDEDRFHQAEIAKDRLLNQQVMGRLFGDFLAEGEPESSIYYTDPDTGVQCRTRMDLHHPEANFDLKTTAFAGTGRWVRHALDLDYDMQAYMYSLADCLFSGREEPLPFVFIAVENDYPFSTSARTAGLSFMLEGGRKYKHALTAYAACEKADFWPTPGGEEVIEVAPWQARQLDLSWSVGAVAGH